MILGEALALTAAGVIVGVPVALQLGRAQPALRDAILDPPSVAGAVVVLHAQRRARLHPALRASARRPSGGAPGGVTRRCRSARRLPARGRPSRPARALRASGTARPPRSGNRDAARSPCADRARTSMPSDVSGYTLHRQAPQVLAHLPEAVRRVLIGGVSGPATARSMKNEARRSCRRSCTPRGRPRRSVQDRCPAGGCGDRRPSAWRGPPGGGWIPTIGGTSSRSRLAAGAEA